MKEKTTKKKHDKIQLNWAWDGKKQKEQYK